LFNGTPFEVAPPEVQRRTIIAAQTLLARRGYYRSEIDGDFGPAMEFALRAYQARFGIEQNGRLDRGTLASLGLLPGQQAPGLTAPRRRPYRTVPSYMGPTGERIYIPR
jgi:peptidoglycan hydrolase-like protein with peptidoglycan-binding domain